MRGLQLSLLHHFLLRFRNAVAARMSIKHIALRAMDPSTVLESQAIRKAAFFPRRWRAGVCPPDGPRSIDGEYLTADDVVVGWRAFPLPTPAPIVVYFHGNGEIAADSSRGMAPRARRAGCALIAVDFRGYGWSTGEPSLRRLCSDAAALAAALPAILARAELLCDGGEVPPIVLYGRSIGSVCAVELASRHEELFAALILESAIENLLDLPMARRLATVLPGGAALFEAVPDPFRQCVKIASLRTPRVLVMHGRADNIVPCEQGGRLHAAVDSSLAEPFERFEGVGHNDIHGCKAFNAALNRFLAETVGEWQPSAAPAAAPPHGK